MTAEPCADAHAPPAVDGVLRLSTPLTLYHGDLLDDPRIAYRLIGPPGAPKCRPTPPPPAHRDLTAPGGWWPEIVGADLGVDTRKLRVLGIDYLGGLGGSSTPHGGTPFPPVSTIDQAFVLNEVVQHLGFGRLHAIVGASYGGMVGLSFAARHAAWVDRIVILSAADRAQVLSTAWRSVQRQIVREAIARGDGAAGLKLARALAMATYRSQTEFAMRFNGPARRDAGRFRFPVEGYLFARGDDYVQKYRAESFLALSESIDLHHVDPADVRTPTTLIAVREDQLVPVADMQSLAARLAGPAHLVEINSIFGHDAFLKEAAMINPVLQKALAEQ
jgi:homoserine O-acetyltransferase